jgi:hypothetical protein
MKIGLAIAGGVLAILFFVGMLATALEEVPIEEPKSNHQIESEEAVKTVEPSIGIEEIYNAVELGMTEDEVRAIAGKPDMVSNSEIEGLGTMRDLIYHGGIVDNVSIFLEDGKVRMVILGNTNDTGDIDTRSKM